MSVLFRPSDFQRLYRIDGDCFDRLGTIVGSSGGYQDGVSPVCELAAGESQGAVVAYGAPACGIAGESVCVC